MVGDTAVAGTISSLANGTQGRGVVFDAIDRAAFAKTWYADFDATLTPTDTWALHFDAGYTQADGDTEAQPFVEFGAPARSGMTCAANPRAILNIDPNNPTSGSSTSLRNTSPRRQRGLHLSRRRKVSQHTGR